MPKKSLKWNLLLALGAVLIALFSLELGLRIFYPAEKAGSDGGFREGGKDIPLHILVDSPVLYTLNPEHPEVNSRRLRGKEIKVPKPAGIFRVLILGDSVTYGVRVARENTFASLLERMLTSIHIPSEVLNAGVLGYTTYNEVQFFAEFGSTLQADLVIIAVCLNDIVNPRLHWNFIKMVLPTIPAEAIPNVIYDREHVGPILEARAMTGKKSHQSDEWRCSRVLTSSHLVRFLARRYQAYCGHGGDNAASPQQRAAHLPDLKAPIPTYITGEDSISIEVLLDETSDEFRWLTSNLQRLHNDVVSSGAKFLVVLFPLAYQLKADYPYAPQSLLSRYLESQAIPCLDLLPLFRHTEAAQIFWLSQGAYYDIWHLTHYGHFLTAQKLFEHILNKPPS